MKNRLHVVAFVLFVCCFVDDIVVWGGVRALPDVGTGIVDSARREAPLATVYIAVGTVVDSAIPPLQRYGAARLTAGLSEGFDRIRSDPTVAMDLIFHSSWNVTQTWIKTMYWAAPILLVVSIVLWIRRPKQIRTIRRR